MALDITLAGRPALVCGASSGLGRAVALAFAGQGAAVTVLARRRDRLEALLPELREAGARHAFALVADLDDRPDALAKVSRHLEAHGPVLILVNNTGGPPPGPLLEADTGELEQAFGRHLLAAQALAGLVVPGMREAGYGRIINIVSTSVREPIVGLGVSNTIRGAMAAWAKTLAKELPPGITVNNILPGYTETERLQALREAVAARTGQTEEEVNASWRATIPEGRLGEPEEIAAVAAFFASPAAAYVRGQSLAVDGGRMASI